MLNCHYRNSRFLVSENVLTDRSCTYDVYVNDNCGEPRLLWNADSEERAMEMCDSLGKAFDLKKDVRSITVIERDMDVIALAGPHYLRSKRVSIIHADALDWKPSKIQRFDVVWHDIWPTISSDNLADMRKLRARFRNHAAWQGCWSHALCLRR